MNIQKNSLIQFKLIEDCPYEYQSYLQRISYYLLGQIEWWEETDQGIMFYDTESNQRNKTSKLKIRV